MTKATSATGTSRSSIWTKVVFPTPPFWLATAMTRARLFFLNIPGIMLVPVDKCKDPVDDNGNCTRRSPASSEHDIQAKPCMFHVEHWCAQLVRTGDPPADD